MRLLSTVRPTLKRSLAVTAALTVAALVTLPNQAGHVKAASAQAVRSMQPAPTIVLKHGAWADGSSWAGVVWHLQRAGYTVDAPPNPLRGLPGDTATLASFLTTVSGPIVLVGHSYGGAVITNAARGNPNVRALVYIGAAARVGPAGKEGTGTNKTQSDHQRVIPSVSHRYSSSSREGDLS